MTRKFYEMMDGGGAIDYGKLYSEASKEAAYWKQKYEAMKQRCEAAENLIAVMNVPRNEPIKSNDQFILFSERNDAWQKSKHTESLKQKQL